MPVTSVGCDLYKPLSVGNILVNEFVELLVTYSPCPILIFSSRCQCLPLMNRNHKTFAGAYNEILLVTFIHA